MKALVCLSRTPDTTSKISFDSLGTSYSSEEMVWIVNPYDEWYALIKSVELQTEEKITSVDLVMVGNSEVEPVLRKAMALGGDSVFRINHDARSSLDTAKALSGFATGRNYDIILGGKETIDFNGHSVMAMLAAALGYTYVDHTIWLDITKDKAHFHSQTAGGYHEAKSSFPLVLSCQKGIAEPKLPTMKGKIAARSKPIETVDLDGFAANVSIQHMEKFSVEKETKFIRSEEPRELYEVLRENHKLHF